MAARATHNRQITEFSDGTHKDQPFNAPSNETENARLEQVGIFHQANLAISQSAVALKLNGLDSDAALSFVAGRAGKIVGIAWALTAAATHTLGTIRATVGGTAVGTAVNIDGGGTSAVADQGTEDAPVSFAEGDLLGMTLTTDANWLPTTTDLTAWLLVRWSA